MGRVYLLLSITTMIAGLTPVAARLATAELPPLSLAFVRFGVAGGLLAFTTKALGMRLSFPRTAWSRLILLAALCVPLNQIGFLFGIKLSNATHAGIAYALVPMLAYWFSLAGGSSFYSHRMTMASTLAVAGAVVVILATQGPSSDVFEVSRQVFLGDGLLLTAAVTWALFVVLSQPVVRRYGAWPTLTVVFLIGTVMHVPLVVADLFYFDLRRFDTSDVTWKGVAGLAYITLITAYTNYLLWYLILARHDVARSTVVTNCAFLVTVIVEGLFLGGALNGWVAVGSAILLWGILLTRKQRAPVAASVAAGEAPPARR